LLKKVEQPVPLPQFLPNSTLANNWALAWPNNHTQVQICKMVLLKSLGQFASKRKAFEIG